MARLRMMRAPQKYVQGKDSLFKFHEEMKDLGNKFLFVCSRSGYKMCHDKIEKSFEGTEDIRQYEIFGGVSSVGEIERMRKIVRENRLNVVVGVGGGSAIDTAKATAHYEKLPVVISQQSLRQMLHVQDFLLFTMMMRHLTAIYFIQRTRKLLLWTVM